MRNVLTVLVCLVCLSAVSGAAQIYRWTDDAGRVHYTDNPGTIPPERRPRSQQLSPTPSGDRTSAPQTTAPPTASEAATGKVGALRQRAQVLRQQIDKALQERQGYLEQIKGVRQIRTNPAFGRKRRRVDELGQSLAATQERIDALQTELRQIEAKIQETEADREARPSVSRTGAEVTRDRQGHDRAYWQQRVVPLRTRLERAQTERRSILAQLAPEASGTGGTFGRRGKEVLRLTQALEQAEQEIQHTEDALQALRQEASRAGAPTEWLQ